MFLIYHIFSIVFVIFILLVFLYLQVLVCSSFFHHFNVFRRDTLLFNLLVIFVFLIFFPSLHIFFRFYISFCCSRLFFDFKSLSHRSAVLSQFVLLFVLSVRRNISFSSYPFFVVVRLYFLMKILFYIIFSSLRVTF